MLGPVGPYGLAIVALTVGIKLVLWPVYQFQLNTSRKTMDRQRMLAPQLAEIKKKYKGDPQKQQEAQMELYREQGINPLSGLGCLIPFLIQYPILGALYFVFRDHRFHPANFLWIPDLNVTPLHHVYAGTPIPTVGYLVIPLLAAATTFVQSKMMQQPPNPNATEQEQQQQQMQQSMQVMMPLLFGYFTLISPMGLGLYWFVSNCIAIIQQYFVTGWGGLRQNSSTPPPAAPGGSSRPAVTVDRPSTNGTPRPPVRRKKKARR